MPKEQYLLPEKVDSLLQLPRGRSARLARRGLLPAVILPDGTVRFEPNIIETLQRSPQQSADPLSGASL